MLIAHLSSYSSWTVCGKWPNRWGLICMHFPKLILTVSVTLFLVTVPKCLWIQWAFPSDHSGSLVQLSVWHIFLQHWATESERGEKTAFSLDPITIRRVTTTFCVHRDWRIAQFLCGPTSIVRWRSSLTLYMLPTSTNTSSSLLHLCAELSSGQATTSAGTHACDLR